jgi:hypothetical protein
MCLYCERLNLFNSWPQVRRNGDFMKRAGRITYALMSFAMLFATTARAANKGPLHAQSTTMAGKTQLPAGEYTVQWEGAGPDVKLKIKLHNRVKATVPAKVIPLDQPLREDAAILDTDSNGGPRLLEIRFSGKRFFFQIEPQSPSTTCADPPLLIPEYESALPW